MRLNLLNQELVVTGMDKEQVRVQRKVHPNYPHHLLHPHQSHKPPEVPLDQRYPLDRPFIEDIPLNVDLIP